MTQDVLALLIDALAMLDAAPGGGGLAACSLQFTIDQLREQIETTHAVVEAGNVLVLKPRSSSV